MDLPFVNESFSFTFEPRQAAQIDQLDLNLEPQS
jgi:hypothetical protein